MPFKNHWTKKRKYINFLVLKWLFGLKRDASAFPVFAPADFDFPHFDSLPSPQSVMWIHHSTFLIKTPCATFLTDPVFSTRCSPFKLFGPKRREKLPLKIEELPQIDYVLLSHNHYDHLDAPVVKKFQTLFPGCLWFIPKGTLNWFKKHYPSIKALEFEWGQTRDFPHFTLSFVPAQHFSGRRLFDRNHTQWGGYIVKMKEGDKKFYFVGDTGYNSIDFKWIGKTEGPIDLALIPIGAYLPRWFMRPMHVDPSDAVQLHLDIRSKLSIAGHFDSFKLADEPFKAAPYELFCELSQRGIPHEQFRALKKGVEVSW